MIGVVSAGFALSVLGLYVLARCVVRLEIENTKLAARLVAIESKALDNDTITAGLCCQVQELENELTAVGAVVFSTTEEPPAASRPN